MWRRPAPLIIVVTIVVEVVLVIAGTEPDLLLVGALGALGGTALWCVIDIRSATGDLDPLPVTHRPPAEPRPDGRVRTLRSGLTLGTHNEHSAQRLRNSLVDIVDDQLRAEHGIDRRTDRSAAHAVCGDDLFRFVDDPDSESTVSRPKQLARIVTLIEQI